MLSSAVHTVKVYMKEYSTHPGKEEELKAFKHLTNCWSENTPQKFFKKSCFGLDWKYWLTADLVKKMAEIIGFTYPYLPTSPWLFQFHWSCSLVFQWLYESCSLIFSQSCLSVILQGYKGVLKYQFFFTKTSEYPEDCIYNTSKSPSLNWRCENVSHSQSEMLVWPSLI